MPLSQNLFDLTDRQWRRIDGGVIVGIVIFVLYFLTAFRFDILFTVEARQVDFVFWYTFPPVILRELHYPAVLNGNWSVIFPYLPSAALMLWPLSLLPRTVAFGLWLLMQAGSFAVILWSSLRLSGGTKSQGRLLILAAAIVLAENPLGWDFRNHQNNLIYLAMIMLGLLTSRVWLSGLLLAASFNLKLYSGTVLAGLIWRREYRLAGAMAVATVVLGVVLPLAMLGPFGYLQLMHDWRDQVLYTMTPAGQALAPASLRISAAKLLGADLASYQATILSRTSQVIWGLLLIGYFVAARRSGPANPYYDRARLADICVMLMAPLPISTWFVPYHAVVLLPAFILLLTVAASDEWPRWLRITAVIALALGEILRLAVPAWELRAAVYFACFMLLVVALMGLRIEMQRRMVASDNAASQGAKEPANTQ